MNEDDQKAILRIIEIRDLKAFRKQADPVEREAWILVARRIFDPGERQPCFVCGKFKSIAQAHHVIPLTAQYDRGFELPDGEFVWLCPNHHAMAHTFIIDENRSLAPEAFRARGKTARAVLSDLAAGEFDKIMELMRRAGRSPE